MIEMKNLNITFQKDIFQNASVTFYDGNIHAVIGPSGCGKTTLIKAILDYKSQCQLYYNEEFIKDRNQFLLNHVFYVDQNGSYFENMSISKHFKFYSELNNTNVNESMINQYLNKVGLSHIDIMKSPSQLSIGERKRFLISLALFSKKDIIILDEPTASLDKNNILLLKEVISSLKEKTIIITTHETEMLEICDVVYEIKDKQVLIKENFVKKNLVALNNLKNKFKPTLYIKYKSKFQWLQQLFLVVLGIFLCIQLGMVFNNEYALYSGLMGNRYLASDNMIYMRKRQANAPNWMYVTGEESNSMPLDKSEKEEIENISGLDKLYTIGNLSVYNPNNMDEYQPYTIIQNNHETEIDKETVKINTPVVQPYYPENKMNQQQKKVFITEEYAMEYGLKKGDSIKLSLYIPTYQYVFQEESESYRYISYKDVEIEFTIDDITTIQDGYKNFSGKTNIIYIPYQQFNDILKDYNGDKTDDKPRSENVKGMPYSYNDYVIFAQQDQIGEVYKELIEMSEDYDVFSQSVYYTEGVQEQSQLQKANILIVSGIGMISAIIYAAIYYFQLRSKRRERQQLLYNGISHQEIKKCLYLESLIHIIGWFGMSLLIVIILGSQFILLNSLIFIGTAIVLALLEQTVIYLVMRKEAKNRLC